MIQVTAGPANFIVASISGGPHDGQTFRCPADQQTVTFYSCKKAYRYHRTNHRPVFYYENRITAAFGRKAVRK